MKITKKRIFGLKNNLPRDLRGKVFVPAIILNTHKDKTRLLELGFSEKLGVGERILPRPIGPVSLFNANGKEISDKTKPKETKYREIEWCWEQWSGYRQTETVCDFRMVPYERWQRIVVAPPSIELILSKKEGEKVFITTLPAKFSTKEEERSVHKINLLLEIFGSCEILDKNQVPVIKTTRSLNWTILPPGKRSWTEQKKLLKPLLDLISDKRTKPVVQSRLEDVNSLGPEFTATGNQGFSGYVIFGFPKKNIYVLESAFYGNAIYVFNQDWENLSKKTKAEILEASLQIERITHNGERANWMQKTKNLLKRHG